MNIKKGVQLINGLRSNKNIFINTGVVHCEKEIPGKVMLEYDVDAYKPKHDWRPLNQEEKKLLIGNIERETSYSSTILLNHLPDHLISLLKKINVGGYVKYVDVLNEFKNQSESLREFQNGINKILMSYAMKNTLPEFHRIVFNPPEIETLTYYMEEQKLIFVGMHIDRSTKFDLSNVETSKNRLCINIGKEDRILYFVNLTLNQIVELLRKKKEIDISHVTINNIAEIFFKEYPEYPVVKVVQRPYDYYIAPTDNVLHDGSSLGKKYHDICLVWTGYFNTYFEKE